MIPQHYGKIINLSSMKSVLGTALTGHSAYAASKGAVSMLTKQLACELAQYGITVSALGPTFIKTDINATLLEDPNFRDPLIRRIPWAESVNSRYDGLDAAVRFRCLGVPYRSNVFDRWRHCIPSGIKLLLRLLFR